MVVRILKLYKTFIFYSIASSSLVVAATRSRSFSLKTILALFVTGIISWCFVEYILHRFIFHYDAKSEPLRDLIYQIHTSHHENPKSTESLFASLRTSVPIASIYCLIVWLVVGSWQAMALVFAGLIAGYFAYEWLHYQAHHRAPRLKLLRYLKKYHLLHHHSSPEMRFGVTTPFVDYLFGTYQSVSKRATVVK
jgi:sterol desaturase/sphingolipid hydroxylase (fatty acid hydroxylase superfamily)